MKTTFVNLRIFSHPWKGVTNKEHSYYVGHEAGGLSESLDTLAVNFSSTFSHLRQQIEEQTDENIMRRRPFYTEFLQFMQRCPNPLGYEGEPLRTYRIGILTMRNDKGYVPGVKDINLVRKDAEVKQICDVFDESVGLRTDIVLVPTTQIHPTTDRLADRL